MDVVALLYACKPSQPPSRPNPLSRTPPKPAAASNKLVALTQTTPAASFGATSSARLMFSVQTVAASPYLVLLAISMASLLVRNVVETKTGPKISSCINVSAACRPVINVGG